MLRATGSVNETQQDYEIAEPDPSGLVESLRAFGYTLKTAIADLIDNSISAKSKNIWIKFEWLGGKSFILIKDDGKGMSETELVSAMKASSKSPLEERDPEDLGRFGLGLKTASFSQCRKLSVFSKQLKGDLVSRAWDLDYINESREWRLLKHLSGNPLPEFNENIEVKGTIVLWEKMDRVVGSSKEDDNAAYKRFLETIEEVRAHLGMVFHRFIEKPNGLKLWINNRKVDAWDPFLSDQNATQELPSENFTYEGAALKITPFILPHQSKISSETHKLAAGPGGWNAQQGFYVYRNKRLLVEGDWLGLGFKKEEHYKLARILIDLPNTMDEAWQIDVKKSRAKPPGELREDLKRIAKLARERAVQIYRHRGKVTARRNSQSYVFLWEQKTRHSKYFYAINRKHPLIEEALADLGKSKLEPVLRMLEETIPSAHIIISGAEEPHKIAAPLEENSYEEVEPLIEKLYMSFLSNGCGADEAIERLTLIEPFNNRPEFIEIFKTHRKG